MNILVRNHLIMRDQMNLLCTGDQPYDYNAKYDRSLNCTSARCWSNPVSHILDDECQRYLSIIPKYKHLNENKVKIQRFTPKYLELNWEILAGAVKQIFSH